jgi:fructokinase
MGDRHRHDGPPCWGNETVLEAGAEIGVISRGASRAIATNGEYLIDLPAPAVDVLETTGAGDGFLAAMIVQLLPWREKLGSLAAVSEAVVRDALDYANSVGALTCTRMGAIPALPTGAEVDAFESCRQLARPRGLA